MDLDALRFAHFGPLSDAVDDWSAMIRDLEALEKSADTGLHRSAKKANWSGVNATVTREFIGKTAGEFTDALSQAKSIRNILRDTCSELKGFQTKLNEAIERGLKKNLTVRSTGDGGFTVTMNIHPDRAAKGTTVPEHNASDVTALRDEVQKILDDATKADSSANTVLRALADQSRTGFSDTPVYKDRDAAYKAVKTADELAKIAKKKPEDLSPRDFDRINQGLKKYANDELFAERFTTRLGPRGTLDFWTGLNDQHRVRERIEKYDDLQKNLSLTLATATQSDSAAMSDWTTKMVGLADKPVGLNGGTPLGGQVMANLMRWGNYDDRFLVDYGEKLIDTEKKFTGNGRHGAWSRLISDPVLNRTGSDAGWDPMTGYLKALSNSPDAATTFFNDTFFTKDEDHDFTKEVNGKEVSKSLSNFDYFFEERDWPADRDDEGNESIAGRNNLALALEAATTGHPAGEMPTADTPPHTADQAALVQNLVASISDDPERLTEHGYMSDSVGQIASEYLADINRATADGSAGNESIKKLFPIDGGAAKLSHVDVTRFLVAVGQNPEGYAAIEVGQKTYMARLMDYHLDPALPSDLRYELSTGETVQEIARRSGEISGTLALGRTEAVLGPAHEEDGDFENAVNQKKNLISGTIGTIAGVGTSTIASPAVGAGVAGVAGTVTSMVLEQFFKDSDPEFTKALGHDIGERWENSKDTSTVMAHNAAASAAKAHHHPDTAKMAEWTRSGTADGFNDASSAGHRMAKDMETEIPD